MRELTRKSVTMHSEWEESRRRTEKGSSECNDSMRKGKKGQKSRLKRQFEILQSEAEKVLGLSPAACSNEPEQDSSKDDDKDTNYYTGNHEQTRFDNWCTIIQWKMRIDLEDLLSNLKSEKSTYQENVWRDVPDHAHLAALLNLLNLSSEEWTLSVSRMDPASMELSLTTTQVDLLKRLDEGALSSSVLLKSRPQLGGPSESWGKREFKGSMEAMDNDSCKGPDLKRKFVALQFESEEPGKMTKQI